MEYRALGKSGLQVSLAGLGTNNFGRRCGEAETKAVIHRAIDLGVNFIDTADVYGDGLSEEFIGKAIRGCRQDVIIGTKFESATGEGPLKRGASRRYIYQAVEASLRRLRVDYIDLYQIHRWDATTPIEETMRALDDLVRQGLVRYIGCSNFAAWQVVEAQWVARSEHLTPLVSVQPRYNLMEREVEKELVPACAKYELSVIPFFPLAGGFLTGKYRQGEPPPPGTRFATPGPFGRRSFTDANYGLVAKLTAFADERDHEVAELALAWLGSQPTIGSVISGATRPEQVEQNVRALEWRLTAEDLKDLDRALADDGA